MCGMGTRRAAQAWLCLLLAALYGSPCAAGPPAHLSAHGERDSASPAHPSNANVTPSRTLTTSQGPASAAHADYLQAYNYSTLDCKRYDPTYAQIDRDLDIHRRLGTSLNATRYIASELGSVVMRGLTVGFFGGRAFLLVPTDWAGLSHHAKLHLAFLRMMLHLEDAFGPDLPDVAFVLTTSDTPRYVSPLIVNASSPEPRLPPAGHRGGTRFEPGPYPVVGICKSDFFPDLLLVPNFHFHMKLYDDTFLAPIPTFNEKTWAEREPVLFGRFSRYRTNRHPDDASTNRLGVGGRRLCYKGNKTCPTREHFVAKVASKHRPRMDVQFFAKLPMGAHTRFKYLLNLDGQGISSRLEQLLPLGSLVFKEASGYYAYYYRSLLRHRVNVLEFWREVPEEVLTQLDWAAQHDAQAAAIAAEGQRTAATYLTGNGRTCYWFRLMHGLHSTLSYTPDLSQWPDAAPLREVIERQLPSTAAGKELYDEPWAP